MDNKYGPFSPLSTHQDQCHSLSDTLGQVDIWVTSELQLAWPHFPWSKIGCYIPSLPTHPSPPQHMYTQTQRDKWGLHGDCWGLGGFGKIGEGSWDLQGGLGGWGRAHELSTPPPRYLALFLAPCCPHPQTNNHPLKIYPHPSHPSPCPDLLPKLLALMNTNKNWHWKWLSG